MSQPKRYVVTVGSRPPVAVDLAFDGATGAWSAEADGAQVSVRLEAAHADGVVELVVDGEPVTLRIVQGPDGTTALAPVPSDGGVRVPVRVRSAGEVVLGSASASTAADAEPVLCAPITGVILDTLVEIGEHVAEGAPVVVLEAMKMETVLRAPCAGRIAALHVQAGDKVRTEQPLVEIASGEAPDRAHLH